MARIRATVRVVVMRDYSGRSQSTEHTYPIELDWPDETADDAELSGELQTYVDDHLIETIVEGVTVTHDRSH